MSASNNSLYELCAKIQPDIDTIQSLLSQQPPATRSKLLSYQEEPDGYSPLYVAVSAGSHQVVELLLAAGADIDTPNVYGETPLNAAAWSGNHQLVEILLAAGADKDSVSNDGKKPVDIAEHGLYGIPHDQKQKTIDVLSNSLSLSRVTEIQSRIEETRRQYFPPENTP